MYIENKITSLNFFGFPNPLDPLSFYIFYYRVNESFSNWRAINDKKC